MPSATNKDGFLGQDQMLNSLTDEILGVLAIFRRAKITEAESDWLRIFADHAATAIANARAFDEVARLRRQLVLERDHLREEVKEALAFGKIGSCKLRPIAG